MCIFFLPVILINTYNYVAILYYNINKDYSTVQANLPFYCLSFLYVTSEQMPMTLV